MNNRAFTFLVSIVKIEFSCLEHLFKTFDAFFSKAFNSRLNLIVRIFGSKTGARYYD